MGAGISVSGLFVYPVKAFRGVERESVTIGRFGFEGDREYQVVGADGEYLTQRQLPRMALVRAEPIAGGLRLSTESDGAIEVARPTVSDVEIKVTFADVRAADCGDDVAAWLEQLLGGPCRLVAITDDYHRPLLIDVGLPDIEVSFADAAPILLTNTASLDDLVARASEPFPMDRFRPNIVVSSAEPWVEDTWKRVRTGGATIHAVLPWPRCAVPQVDQATAERHKEPAKVLRAHRWCTDGSAVGPLGPFITNEPLFGMGVAASPMGATITVGDSLDVIEAGPPALAPPEPLTA